MPTDTAASITSSVKHLLDSVSRLLVSVRGAVASSRAERVDTSRSTGPRLASRPTSGKRKKALKSYWANLKGKAREERIKKMLAGRGLKPKVKKPPTARGLALKKALKASWARMTPAERATRIAKMQAGRGIKPKPAKAPAA